MKKNTKFNIGSIHPVLLVVILIFVLCIFGLIDYLSNLYLKSSDSEIIKTIFFIITLFWLIFSAIVLLFFGKKRAKILEKIRENKMMKEEFNNKKKMGDIDFKGKTVLLRCDFNVPHKKKKILDENRIIQSLPTINYLIKRNTKIIIFSHLGRITNLNSKYDLSLDFVAKRLSKLLKKPVIFIKNNHNSLLKKKIFKMPLGTIVLLENTRYQDLNNNAESKNSPELGKYWASLGDVFVNDAFGTCHRSHASNVGISSYIKNSCIGFLVEKECKNLMIALYDSKHPIVSIIGGAKISDKIGVLKNLGKISEKIIIGGGMSYTFLLSQGNEIGKSMVQKDKIIVAEEILSEFKNKIILPIDHAISKNFANEKPRYTTGINIPKDYMALDIGPKSIKLFTNILQKAATIIWNGPMGVCEFSHFKKGTLSLCEVIKNNKKAFTMVGGGDSAAAVIELGYEDKFSFISTGGGAALEFLEGKKLPGITAIKNK